MDIFRTRLEIMKSKCVHHQDDRYWNILDNLTPNENPRENLDKTSTWNCLELETKDGFHIKIIFWYMPPYHTHFKGFVKLPSSIHPVVKRWIDTRWNRDSFDLDPIYKWDHGTREDACLLQPILPDGPDKISGPVQVLEEAREVIKWVLFVEQEIMCRKKQQETRMIEEELMARAVSPERVEKWVNEGFEMFP